MNDKLKPVNEIKERSSHYSEGIRVLIEDPRFETDTKGFYSHQTHSKAGEHVILYYNSHEGSDLPGEYFLQTYPPGHVRLLKDNQLDSFKWSDFESPELLYPDQLDRIDSLLSLFGISKKGTDG